MKCLDCRLSGSDLPGALRRTLTDLDVALLDPIGKAVVNELASTLSKYIPVRAHIVRHITEKYMMEGVTLSLTWLVAWMTVSIGGSTFDASICFPIVPLQPVLIALADEAAHGTHLPNPEDGAPLDDWVPELEVELSVHFPKIKLHMSDIAALAPGSLIGLGQDPSALLLMSARNRLFATVEPKVAGHKLAATVAEMIEDPEEFIDTY